LGIPMNETHQHRRAVLKPFLKRAAVQNRVETSAPLLEHYVARWTDTPPSGATLQQDVLDWSIHALGLALCGDDWDLDRDVRRYHQAIEGIEEAISIRAFHPPFVRWLFVGHTRKASADVAYFRHFLAEMLERRMARALPPEAEPEDILGLMAQLAGEGHKPAGKPLIRWSKEVCVGELMSLLAGGTDAICHAASQSLHYLGTNPDVQRRIHGAMQIRPGVETLVLHEAIRLSPPLPLSAKFCPSRPFEILGFSVPKGTMLLPFRPLIGADSTLYPNPESFEPERFATTCPHRQSLKTLVPFGSGPRICPGQDLTQELVSGFLRSVIRAFRVEGHSSGQMEVTSTIAARAATLPMVLHPRDASAQDLKMYPPDTEEPPVPGRTPGIRTHPPVIAEAT